MGYFESLVDQYHGRTPPHFEAVAARLRDGASALSVRRQLEAEQDLSRFKAGKIVEDVEKAIDAWRISLGTGIGLLIVVLALFSPYHPVFWIGLVVGAAQSVAGMRGMQQYQSAVDPGSLQSNASPHTASHPDASHPDFSRSTSSRPDASESDRGERADR